MCDLDWFSKITLIFIFFRLQWYLAYTYMHDQIIIGYFNNSNSIHTCY